MSHLKVHYKSTTESPSSRRCSDNSATPASGRRDDGVHKNRSMSGQAVVNFQQDRVGRKAATARVCRVRTHVRLVKRFVMDDWDSAKLEPQQQTLFSH